MKRLSTKMEAHGTQLGKDFERGLNKTNLDGAFDRLAASADRASTRAENSLHKVTDSARHTTDAVGDLGTELEGVAASARKVRLGGIGGGRGGTGFRQAADDAGWFRRQLNELSSEGAGVRRTIAGIHDTVAFMGTAVSGAVGGLSAAAQGIFAVGANAASATPALAVFANGLIGIAQIGATVAISMQGVGNAITAGFNQLDAVSKQAMAPVASVGKSMTGLGKATESAARGVRDAKQSLQDAYREAARSAADAARRVVDAEHALAAAQMASAAAQKGLNAARAEGLQQMRDIAFAAEDAGLAEQRAKLDLADAQQQLIATSELAPDDRARIEAELAFKEADLNLREATARREDADKAQKDSVKKGIEGTDAMIQAHQDVADAQDQEAQATQDLADARREEARTAQDNARRIADAQQAVADAQRALAEAQKSSAAATAAAAKPIGALTTAANNYQLALQQLGPEQRRFVERIVGLRDEWLKARAVIADPLFEGVNRALTTLLQGDLLPKVGDQLEVTSGHLGDFVADSAKMAESPVFQQPLLNVLRNNNRNMVTWGDTLQNLAVAFVNVADAARPLVTRFTNWANAVSESWRQTTVADNRTGKLTNTLKTAGDRVAEFWNLFKELWRTLKLVGSAANDAANNFGDIDRTAKDAKKNGYIDYLTDKLKEFNDALDTPGRKAAMIDRFTAALENLNSVGGAFKTAILDPLIQMGGDRRIGEGFDKIAGSDAFARLAASANEAAPALGDLVVNVADLLAAVSESGSMKVFLDDVGAVAKFLSDMVNKVDPGVLRAIGTALGTIAAVRFVGGIGQKFLAAITPPGLDKIPGKIKGIGPKVEAAGTTVKKAGNNIAVGFAISFTDGMAAAGTELIGASKAAVKKIANAMGLDEGAKIGRDLIKGIAVGIKEGSAAIAEVATQAGAAIVREMKAGMGVKSPSTLTAAAGRDVMKGVVLGIEEGLPAAETAAATAGRTVGTTVGSSMKTSAATSTTGLGTTMGTAVSAEVTTATKSPRLAGALGGFTKVFSGAAKGLGTAMRGLGGAMNFMMGPWGLLITILLPLLMPLLQKLNDKFKITDKLMAALKWTIDKVADAFTWLWENALVPMFDWISSHWRLLLVMLTGPFGLAVVLITKYWDQIWRAITFVFNWVRDHWKTILVILTGPIGIAVGLIIRYWDQIKAAVQSAVGFITGLFGTIWDGILTGWNKIAEFFNGLWSDRIKPFITDIINKSAALLRTIWNGIKAGWTAVGQFIANLWRNQIQPKIDALIKNAWNRLKTIWNAIKTGWTAVGRWMGSMWAERVKPKIDSLITSAWAKLKTIWDGIKQGWNDLRGWFDGLWNSISTKVTNNLITPFSNAVKGVWKGIEDGLKSSWNWVADKIEGTLESGINAVLGKFGVDHINFDIPRMATGGPVRGPGGPTSDRVLTALSNGEYVLPAKSAKKLGPDTLEYMRKHGEMPAIGGWLGNVWGKFKDATSALAHGAETAAKWIIGHTIGEMGDGGGFVGDAVRGSLKKFTGEIVKWVVGKQPVTAGGHYTGPPGGWTKPVFGYVITQYPNTGHSPPWSVDLAAPLGTPVYAASRGVVSSALKWNYSYGNHITISHAGGQSTLYAHLQNFAPGIAAGVAVKTGQLIGHVDSTGHSTGNHLHFELRPSSSTITAMAAHGVHLAAGGVVAPSPTGTLALLAEAGKHERVTPLDSEGFTPAERRVLEALESQFTGSGDTFHVHPSQKMDERSLADLVARRVAWKRRRGGGFR